MPVRRSLTFPLLALLSIALGIHSPGLHAQDSAAAGGQVSGFIRIMPRFFKFSGDQGYLQRYQTLRPPNDQAADRFLDTVNGLELSLLRPKGGAPYLELLHFNPHFMNDEWSLRLRPLAGVRFDLQWNDYQSGFERFLPPTAPETISYARRFNLDFASGDYLRRRRGDFRSRARWEPSAGPVRSVDFEYQRGNRRGYRQFNWMFGIAEDLVVPVGIEDSRWRGRAEPIHQTIDRYSAGVTLALHRNNITRFRYFGERLDNRAALFTNADVARLDSAINRQPRTINFIPDNRVLGGEIWVEQKLHRTVTVLAHGLLEDIKQTSFAPLQTAAGYHGRVRQTEFGVGLSIDLNEKSSFEAFSRWRQRKNKSQIGNSSQAARPYLMADRNLSTPFLRSLTEASLGGSFTQQLKGVTLRVTARHENAKREFIRGTGANAIAEILTLYHPRSKPTDLSASASGRPKKQFRWSVRGEFRTADETQFVNSAARRARVRGQATLARKSGKSGATVSFAYEDESNDQFQLRKAQAAVPMPWEARRANLGVQGWVTPSDKVQIHAAFQHLKSDHQTSLVMTDVRRWLPPVSPSLIEAGYGYGSSAQLFQAGASVVLNSRVTLLPSLSLAVADGGVVTAKTPTRDYTLIANGNAGLGIGADFTLTERNTLHLRYDYNRYNDDVTSALNGRYQGFSFGLSHAF